MYSDSTGNLFCVPCLLFEGKSSFATKGFCNWRKTEEKIIFHENSKSHKSCVLSLKQRMQSVERIDQQIIHQMESEEKYLKHVLYRVIEVVKSLCSRCLSPRGSNGYFGSTHSGNFIMCLELIENLILSLLNISKNMQIKVKEVFHIYQ